MFCPQCGKQIKEGAVFCPFCGKKIVQAPAAAEPAQPSAPVSGVRENSFGKTPKIVAAVFGAIIVLIFIIVACGSSDIDTVKASHWSSSTKNMTIGKAFDNFFSDGQWEEREVNGNHYVYFTGKCADTQDGSDSEIKISFLVNTKTKSTKVVKCQIDGVDYTSSGGDIVRQICNGQNSIQYSIF